MLSSFKLDKSYDLIPFNRKRYPDIDAFWRMLPFSDMASINKELEMDSFAKVGYFYDRFETKFSTPSISNHPF